MMRGLKRGIQLAAVALTAFTAGAQDAPDTASEKQRLLEIGRTHAAAWDLYQSLQEQAGGGQQPPSFDRLPDWSGLWTRAPDADTTTQGLRNGC